VYFVAALAEAPASARLHTSDPADRMTSAAAIVTMLLYIASSSWLASLGSKQLSRTSFDVSLMRGLCAPHRESMTPYPAMRKDQSIRARKIGKKACSGDRRGCARYSLCTAHNAAGKLPLQ
jgi:hypothetical protein